MCRTVKERLDLSELPFYSQLEKDLGPPSKTCREAVKAQSPKRGMFKVEELEPKLIDCCRTPGLPRCHQSSRS